MEKQKLIIILLIISLVFNVIMGIAVWQDKKRIATDTEIMKGLLLDIPSSEDAEVVK